MGESFDSSFRGALLVRLVIEGVIIIIVPLSAPLLLDAQVSVIPVPCISIADDIAQVLVISVSSSVTFLRWSETTGRVPVRTLSVVRVLTPHSVVVLENQIHHDRYVQHCLEALNMRVEFFIVLGQVGCEFIDDHP
jgi:hypothetical protein